MNVLVQLARNSGLRVRVNCKVTTTAADHNKQGDVQAIEFGIPGTSLLHLLSPARFTLNFYVSCG